MRRLFWSLLLSTGFFFVVGAQEIQLQYGYQFGTKLTSSSDYLAIDKGNQFGLGFGWRFADNSVAQLTYTHQPSALLIKDREVSPDESRLADVTASWIQLNALIYLTEGNITPFLGGGAGWALISFSNENRDIIGERLDSKARLALSLKGGVVFWLSELLGLKLQGDIFAPINGFSIDTILNDNGDDWRATRNLRFISPYLGFNAGMVFRF